MIWKGSLPLNSSGPTPLLQGGYAGPWALHFHSEIKFQLMSTSPRAAETNYTVFNISFIAQLKYLKIHLYVFCVLQELTRVLSSFVVHPLPPFQQWEEHTETEIELHWEQKEKEIELFCQAEVWQPNGKAKLV